MQTRLSNLTLTSLALAVAFNAAARTDFTPIPLTPGSFNQDMVVEKTAPPPVVPVTTASMDTGTANTGFGWYERGHCIAFPNTGLPPAGTVFSHDSFGGYDYQLAPNYKTNNVVLIDSVVTSGTLTLSSPAPYASLSFLVCAGNGSGTIGYSIHYQNGSTQPGTLACPSWMGGSFPAVITYGQVDVNSFVYGNLNYENPRIYNRDVALANSSSPVMSIDFAYTSGDSHNVVFAVSGAPNSGDPFAPISVTGYNQDMIVEASAIHPGSLNSSTTATMDQGTFNSYYTWYEQGYFPLATNTGLPPANSTLISATAPDHSYQLPASYAANNAVLIDADAPLATLTPATPVACSVLSFLGAASHGRVTNTCVVHHADGTSENTSLILPDWYDTAPAVFAANGQINIGKRMVDTTSSSLPKLFAADVALSHSVSPVTSIDLSLNGSSTASHEAIFALSGRSGSPPVRPTLSISLAPDGKLTIESSAPGQLQSTTALCDTNTIWADEGPISGPRTFTPASGEPIKFYRAIAQ
jgi:hypothetical protein